MDKAIPCGSKICTKRIKDREQQLHRERVRNMKSQVDTGMPTVAQLDHVKVNLKKEQMMEDRYTEIDRDNRILLKKMTDIMKQQTTFTPTGERKSGPSSLNKDARKKELIRITRENQCILKRIQQAQPVYNHVEWEDQHRRNVTYLKNRCEFPVVLRTPRRERYASSELVHLGEEEAGDMTSRSAPSTSRGPPKDVLQDFADGTNQKYVLKEGMKLSDNYYLVDMSTDGRNLFVSAYDNTTSNTLELVIKERLHRQLYRETNGDYRQIADRLKVSGDGKLLLDGEEAPGQAASEELDAAAMTRRSNNRQPHTAR
ncbi:Cfap97d1 [Symbiodinium sp. CCMP2592]|nr:Cfap97d1 [Symbiodinium sp. CCMP2592]